MNTSLRFGPDDRGLDGKILTLDQLLADSRQAITAPPRPADDLSDPLADTPKTEDERPKAADASLTTRQMAISLGFWLIVLAGIAYYFIFRFPTAIAPPASPAATQVSARAAATPAPTAAMLPAYSAPDVPLGQIEATRAITPVAHFGGDWIQAIVSGSGRIWLRAADWPSLAIVGPDLAPPPVRAAAPVSAPAAPFVPEATPPPPPPTQCAEQGIAGKMVKVCGADDLRSLEAQANEQWIATYGGNVGIVGTPSPQIVR